MWLLMIPTLLVVSQPLIDLHSLSFSSGDFNAGGTGARAGDVDDGLFPGLEGRDNSASPSSYRHTLPDNDDHVIPLFSHHNAVPGGSGDSKILMVLIVVLPMLVCTLTFRVLNLISCITGNRS